jgi:hypothetical protein
MDNLHRFRVLVCNNLHFHSLVVITHCFGKQISHLVFPFGVSLVQESLYIFNFFFFRFMLHIKVGTFLEMPANIWLELHQ